MGQGHHVPGRGFVVDEDVGVYRRHHAVAVGPAPLAGSHRGVNPMVVKEHLGGVGHTRVESGERVQNDFATFVPRVASIGSRQRRVAVIVKKFV